MIMHLLHELHHLMNNIFTTYNNIESQLFLLTL
jgi:hypothetical protein